MNRLLLFLCALAFLLGCLAGTCRALEVDYIGTDTNGVVVTHSNVTVSGTATVQAVRFPNGTVQTTAPEGAADLAALGAVATNGQQTASNAIAIATNALPMGPSADGPDEGVTAQWKNAEIQFRVIDGAFNFHAVNDGREMLAGLTLQQSGADLYAERFTVHPTNVALPDFIFTPRTNGPRLEVGAAGSRTTYDFATNGLFRDGVELGAGAPNALKMLFDWEGGTAYGVYDVVQRNGTNYVSIGALEDHAPEDYIGSEWVVLGPITDHVGGGGGGGLTSPLTATLDAGGNAVTNMGTAHATNIVVRNDNGDYTNVDGAGAHLLLDNPDGSQNVVISRIGGQERGKWRTDNAGNLSWIANGGSHTFYVGGDYGSGTAVMDMTPDTEPYVDVRTHLRVRTIRDRGDGNLAEHATDFYVDNGSGETMAYTGTEDVLQPDGSGGFVTNRWTFIFGRFISKEPAP
jgi:hypothetical protein